MPANVGEMFYTGETRKRHRVASTDRAVGERVSAADVSNRGPRSGLIESP